MILRPFDRLAHGEIGDRVVASDGHVIEIAGIDGLDPRLRPSAFYALAKVQEDLGQKSAAFVNCERAGFAMRAILPIDIASIESYVTRVKENIDGAFLERGQDFGISGSKPIFIVGMPRSGTSLVEAIIAAHPNATAGGELKMLRLVTLPLGNLEADELDAALGWNTKRWTGMADEYLKRLQERFGKGVRVADKNLFHVFFIGLIKILYPDAKIIHVTRQPMDVIWSCYRTHFTKGNPWANNLDDTLRFYQAYMDLMAHWDQLMPDFIHTLSYEAVVGEPADVTKALLEYCELDMAEACLAPQNAGHICDSPAGIEIRAPIHAGRVHAWKKYEGQLAQTKAKLGD